MAPPDCIILLEDTTIGKCYVSIVISTYAHVQNASK